MHLWQQCVHFSSLLYKRLELYKYFEITQIMEYSLTKKNMPSMPPIVISTQYLKYDSLHSGGYVKINHKYIIVGGDWGHHAKFQNLRTILTMQFANKIKPYSIEKHCKSRKCKYSKERCHQNKKLLNNKTIFCL